MHLTYFRFTSSLFHVFLDFIKLMFLSFCLNSKKYFHRIMLRKRSRKVEEWMLKFQSMLKTGPQFPPILFLIAKF